MYYIVGNVTHYVNSRLKELNTLFKEKEMEDLEKRLKYNWEYPFCIYPEIMPGRLLNFGRTS
jgi:hypothetical protein